MPTLMPHYPEKACPREGGGCRRFGEDHAQKSMTPKKVAPAKAGVADFSDKIMLKIMSVAGSPYRKTL
jgi:hypothetical protein